LNLARKEVMKVKINLYKHLSLMLSLIASLFVVQSSMFVHKPEVPEELIQKFS
jgi:cyclic lactone autoinducer peptide